MSTRLNHDDRIRRARLFRKKTRLHTAIQGFTQDCRLYLLRYSRIQNTCRFRQRMQHFCILLWHSWRYCQSHKQERSPAEPRSCKSLWRCRKPQGKRTCANRLYRTSCCRFHYQGKYSRRYRYFQKRQHRHNWRDKQENSGNTRLSRFHKELHQECIFFRFALCNKRLQNLTKRCSRHLFLQDFLAAQRGSRVFAIHERKQGGVWNFACGKFAQCGLRHFLVWLF